ncbi:YecA family protein [uncultured Amphritea sp.]|uniref:YecA/YgfB family protein n=1 Tax=Amphritea sp. TaxID=1872502 RepID=UPI001D785B42|nr:YecA family protein [uncultured Amphritea sp.]MBR9869432.1 YecA family protein [Oceanospirillales bacterium]MBR9890008.1 YecA family protein [Oceanospirillales bacterium]
MQNAMLNTPLTDEELDELEAFMFSDAVSEDALDLVGTHGYFCALNISPVKITEKQWLQELFDGVPEYSSETEKARIEGLLRRLYFSIGSDLYNDQDMLLPCELTLETEEDEEQSSLTSWAQAFMEAVFLKEDEWFNHQAEEEVAELMLPIMIASELFDDEEFVKMRADTKLCDEMCRTIPDLLVDLYLLFHAPADKK